LALHQSRQQQAMQILADNAHLLAAAKAADLPEPMSVGCGVSRYDGMVDISRLEIPELVGFVFWHFPQLRTDVPFYRGGRNRRPCSVLTAMDNNDLQARTEQALVIVTLSTATLIACFGLLVSSLN
jgi:hypothetical protein